MVRKPIGAKALVLFAFPLYESIPPGNSIPVALRRAKIVSKAVGIGNAGFLGCGPLKRTSPLPFSPQTLFWPLGPLTLAKADARTAAVLVDEFDAGQSEDQSY
jgi:hypothetical protein